ncbi:acyl-CoA thioesterase [Carboxylicivirga mesophila]|uniref:Acyl-CoA thioesterase n=1 Tax=Carboxylicivirga mesophila TaxID=1166478 RepID=A0ABS5KD13_9BACT|nr:hotdog domain-containing protein [Carboxylicivirga mesophila]MBS2212238.1 acyl-CoA thioesterase [Carboxylicivirga mesophila]
MHEQIINSETRICKAIFPNTLNANNSLFGGLIMQWMDEAAYIAATRFTKQRMFTHHVSEMKFIKAVVPNTIAEVIAKVVKADALRLTIKVTLIAEEMYADNSYTAAESVFTMVALNEQNKPQKLRVHNFETICC